MKYSPEQNPEAQNKEAAVSSPTSGQTYSTQREKTNDHYL